MERFTCYKSWEMIRSGVGLIVERRFVERDVGRTTMTGTDCLLV